MTIKNCLVFGAVSGMAGALTGAAAYLVVSGAYSPFISLLGALLSAGLSWQIFRQAHDA